MGPLQLVWTTLAQPRFSLSLCATSVTVWGFYWGHVNLEVEHGLPSPLWKGVKSALHGVGWPCCARGQGAGAGGTSGLWGGKRAAHGWSAEAFRPCPALVFPDESSFQFSILALGKRAQRVGGHSLGVLGSFQGQAWVGLASYPGIQS